MTERKEDEEESRSARQRVAFIHPDLGLGGAERLIVDAAVELSTRGCEVDVFTAHHDPNRCFEETRTEEFFRVLVRATWFPRTILGRCIALCAYLRCAIIAVHIAIACRVGLSKGSGSGSGKGKGKGKGRSEKTSSKVKACYDVVIVDQVSFAVLPLKLLCPKTVKVVFYCHYPDQLLCVRRGSGGVLDSIKRAYRWPLDRAEEVTTGMADVILVNSEFTRGVFYDTFKTLHAGQGQGQRPSQDQVDVLYPAVAIQDTTWKGNIGKKNKNKNKEEENQASGTSRKTSFLSINRFERKKNIALAVKALKELHVDLKTKDQAGEKEKEKNKPLPELVLAGGYDERLPENVEYLRYLKRLASDLGIGAWVSFFPSFTDEQREELLDSCTCVLYTPEREHFGIVPLEAMASGKPVIACNSGGPLETVRHEKTGFICDPTPSAFAEAMKECLMDEEYVKLMGMTARQHVKDNFSRKAFGDKLFQIVESISACACTGKDKKKVA